MAPNPFEAKSFVKKSDDLPKSSADVPSASEVSKGVTQKSSYAEPVFKPDTRKSSGRSGGDVVKEGLYAELSPEGKLMVDRQDESSRFTGSTVVSSRTPKLDEPSKGQDISYSSSVVRSVERGEPSAVYTGVTGQSLKEERGVQRETIKSIEDKRMASLRAERNVEANRELELRKARAIASAKESVSRGVYDSGQVKRLESLPVESFAPLSFGRIGLDISKKGRERLDKDTSLYFDIQGVERGTYYGSKTEYASKDFGGKVLSTFSEAELVQLGLDVGGYRGSGSKRSSVQYDLAVKEFKSRGYSESEARDLARSVSSGSRIRQVAVGSAQIAPEVASEAVGARILGTGLSRLGRVESSVKGASDVAKITVPRYVGLGAVEGASTVAITEQAKGDVRGRDVLLGASFGAFTAPVFGAIPLSLEVKGGGKSFVGKTLRKVGEFADAPSEQLGDITYARLGSKRVLQQYDLDFSGVKTVTFTKGVKTPSGVSPVDVFSVQPTQTISRVKTNQIFMATPDIGMSVPSSSRPIDSPINVFGSSDSSVPVEVPSVVPSIAQSVVPTVVSASGLPLVPPMFDFGRSGVKGSQRQGRRYFNELELGLSFLGGKRSAKRVSSKKSTKRDDRFKNVDLGLGTFKAWRY